MWLGRIAKRAILLPRAPKHAIFRTTSSNFGTSFSKSLRLLMLSTVLGVGLISSSDEVMAYAETHTATKKKSLNPALIGTALDPAVDPEKRYPNLPVYTLDEVSKHDSAERRIWVTLNGCVYDITDFLSTHPGGDKILAARGAQAEPYWSLYPIHYKSPLVLQHLDNLRVGVLCAADREKLALAKRQLDANSPFRDDPERHSALLVLEETPFNAETPMRLAGDSMITPTALWFTRHHHPVPRADEQYRLRVRVAPAVWERMRAHGFELSCGPGGCAVLREGEMLTPALLCSRLREDAGVPLLELSVEDLQRLFPAKEVTTTIVCAGNRRNEMNAVERTDGLAWGAGAASTGAFGGVGMRGLWAALGVDEDVAAKAGATDVIMKGMDAPFDASIPVVKALAPTADTLVALRMNGEELTRDHGYPARAVVPGYVGVRNVKWLSELILSDTEASSPWQAGAPYKGFSPAVKSFAGLDTKSMVSVNTVPVMSAIIAPAPGQSPPARTSVYPCPDAVAQQVQRQVHADRKPEHMPVPGRYDGECQCVEVRGWAYAGGGRGIVRVDLTSDGGKVWVEGEIEEGPSKRDMEAGRAWTWSLWRADVPVPSAWKDGDEVAVQVRAVDSGFNAQPESVEFLWNKRGVLNNAWFTGKYTLAGDEDDT